MSELQRRPTLMDVAEAAGVSRALVSIVMRGAPGAAEATRQRVLQAASDLGYRADSRARLLRSSRTKLLGLAFSSSQPFHAEIVDAAYAEASAKGYEITLSAVAGGRPEARAIETLLDVGAEALIIIAPTLSVDDLALHARQVPVVSLLRDDVGDLVDSVSSDDHAGIALAVDHLVSLGHRRIVHVDGGTAVSSDKRREAYRTEMIRHRLQPVVVSGGPGEEDGMGAGQILQADLPTAVIAFNDRSALGIMESFRAAGISIPADVSVLGYDDSNFAKLSYVQLSSVSQDAPLLAAAAVGRAVDRIEGAKPPGSVVRTPHLVTRKTTARAPEGNSDT
ncbi:LacI family transcriptional regulator [Arthrobacter sp. AK01]|uniref:LacI family DNA-binding transcriptional regulator n=1 Tax=Micrococcaceae TaxID=1268 RepID=UPI001E569DEA|nr:MULTISPECIES: LacI family DNA-binding transcriptional regulator [Micrococcaceae]MCD4851449.1 LacI family transcriptional regulator [Arthrobacter sp. AK01]MCP1412345.1 DNA-binding LacI/PurR family transcriptional regulator [Paenarthrobacter sp. A20]